MSNLICEELLPDGRKISLHQGDLTRESVDAIVNAANSYLMHGGGVAGAIVRSGGEEIQQESGRIVSRQGPVPVGSAVITGAGRLPCKSVIHAVGPQWGEGEEDAKLRSAIRTSLDLSAAQSYATVAFPAISSGIFGFPKDRCAVIFWQTVREWLEEHPEASLREVRFTNFDDETIRHFRTAWEARR